MFEYWYQICKNCNWDKSIIRKEYKKSVGELKDVFLLEPIKLIKGDINLLIFLYGEKYASLIKKYQKFLENKYIDNDTIFPGDINELSKDFKNLFNQISFDDLRIICQELNWDKNLINEWMNELKNDNISCSITAMKKKFLKFPLQIMDLEENGLNFLFNPKKVEILITYKSIIIDMIKSDPSFTFDFILIVRSLTMYFQFLMKKCNFNYQLFDCECKKIGITREKLAETLSLLRKDLKRLEPKSINDLNVPKQYLILEKLLSLDDKKEVIEFLDNSGIELNFLKSSIHDFLIRYHYTDYFELKELLKQKIKYYFEYKNREKQQDTLQKKMEMNKEKEILEAKKYITLFVENSHQTKVEFCLENNLSLKKFELYVSVIKANDLSLYKLYLDKIHSIIAQKYTLLLKNLEMITDLIKNGVKEAECIRPFDLLDYYQITHLSRAEFLNILKNKKNNLPTTDVNLVLKFLRKYENSRILNKNDLISRIKEKDIIGIEFDSNNNPIANTGRLVTKEEKVSVVNYLKENNIPLYDYCYDIALKRYINGTLSISDNNKKSK